MSCDPSTRNRSLRPRGHGRRHQPGWMPPGVLARRAMAVLLCVGLGCNEQGVEPPSVEELEAVLGDRCEQPEAIPQSHSRISGWSGLVRCDDGFEHRMQDVGCFDPRRRGTCKRGDAGDCSRDGQCDAQPYGRCDMMVSGCRCAYGCKVDADCNDNEVCLCPTEIGEDAKCVRASCSTLEQCDNGLCGAAKAMSPCGETIQFACSDSTNVCRVDADCDVGECEGNSVRKDCQIERGEWVCGDPSCGGSCE